MPMRGRRGNASPVTRRAGATAAGAAARGVAALAALGAAAVLDAVAVGQLVAQAALETAALSRQLRRIQAELLLLRHLDRHRLERGQPGRAAQRSAAGPVAAE